MRSARPLRRLDAELFPADPDPAASDPAARVLLRAQGLTKVYRMGEVEVQALRGVDLDLRTREFIVLLGASGSGKSTLLNILGGLDRPSSGQLWWREQDLCAATDSELTQYRRHQVGFVFQFYNLVASLTARENVELVTDLCQDPMPAAEALERVGLSERTEHFPSQLSGGEQQRVAIARAIAKRPALLLCDEPTGALDYPTGKRVLDVLAQVNQQLATTVMIITHNVAIGAMADRVLHMADGQISHEETHPVRASAADLSW